MARSFLYPLIGFVAVTSLGACTITHKHVVEAPDEPIRLEFAIKIDQEVRVRLDDDVEALIEDNPDLF